MESTEKADDRRSQLIEAISLHQNEFSLSLGPEEIARLADFYDIVQRHNPLLHLVGPCTAEEFAIRHILESLTLLPYLEQDGTLIDVGPGGGFPSIPCVLIRADLHATLIESKEKKAKFLSDAVVTLGIQDRVAIVNRQFTEVAPDAKAAAVTCRALDRFVDNLPRLVKWSGSRELLFFGGRRLEDRFGSLGVKFEKKLMPCSDQRYLLIAGGRA